MLFSVSRQNLARAIATLLVAAAVVWGCAATKEEAPESKPAELSLTGPTAAPSWAGPIPVCFEKGTKQLVANAIRGALQYSWPTSSMITYCFLEGCPTSGLYVVYVTEPVKNWDQISGLTQGTRIQIGYCEPTLGGDCTHGDEVLREYAIHEFGHVLGFSHEHQRPDRPADLGSWCPDATAEYMTAYPIECGIQEGNWLSSEYDPSSIMNYCRDQDDDRQADGFRPQHTWNDRLSLRDMRGVAKKYGYRFPAFHLNTLYQ